MTKAIKHLNYLLYQAKLLNTNLPAHAVVKPAFKESSANETTKSIIAYIDYLGGYAVRINTQGQYNEKLGKWTKSQTRKGTSDIHACLMGRFFSIEVKHGRDKQSPEQVATQKDVEASKGRYFVAKSFQEFYDYIEAMGAAKIREALEIKQLGE